MKKILILLMPLFLLVPQFMVRAEVINSPEPFDYKNGLLDDEIIVKSNNMPENFYDNNLSSSGSVSPGDEWTIQFNHPVHIKGVFQDYPSARGRHTIYYSDGSEDSFEPNSLGYTNLDFKDVISIVVFRRPTTGSFQGGSLREIDFFGSYDTSVDIPTDPGELQPDELKDVKNLKVETEPARVNLSWELPETDHFEHVNIYRKDLGKNDHETSVFDFLKPMTVHASSDDFRAIFETNGTYFNDLTVEENSKYEYKLTTEYEGLESQGVIVQATTPISPAPPLEGGGGEQQANGDYLFKWESPREGQVRIFVDGNEYATVEASTGQLLIPGSDMKYSALGKPLISYQTIGMNGEESNITSPDISDLEIPVTPGDVIETGSQLIGIVSSFILLGLSFIFAPKLIKFIRQSFSNKKEDSDRGREREQRESRTSIRETRQTRQGRTRTRTARTYREGRA